MGVLLLYLGITIIGYFVGAFLRKKGTFLKGIGMIQTIAITLLVFVMGSRIGSNESIVKSLDTIGLVALALTLFILAGSIAAVFLTRKILGFDREGDLVRKAERRIRKVETELLEAEAILEQEVLDTETFEDVLKEMLIETEPEESAEKVKVDNTMTICIVASVAVGILAGYFLMPKWYVDISGTLIVIGLCLLLFFVGMDIGTEGTIGSNFKQAGWRIFVFPLAVIVGTLGASALASLFLPIGLKGALCVGAGFGWYSLAPAMLVEYSARISAISFMHNVMRELFAILLIPLVAKKIGYIESTCLPGAAAMDVCLPIVERATKGDIAVYSFISGVVLSVAVPVLVSFFMGL